MAPSAFCDILLGGLAPDGGLALPEAYPQIDRATLDAWRNLSYPELALEIMKLFADDIPADDLKKLVFSTYTAEVFGSADITPLTQLEPGLSVLGLSNGPTLAFKDVAMQFLGHAFEYVLKLRGETLNIFGATSGDTGSAAEYAMRGKEGIRVFMLSPHEKMSPFQQAQMYSLQDENIFNIAVRGVFDDCQDMVKAVSNDHAFKAAHKIGTVNSINWARVLAQVVYYFKGYFAATTSNDEKVSFCVPSGNFGNVCAGHIARMMGLPIGRLMVATNENDVLDEFFRTGVYRPRVSQETRQTSSPSMDISKASNFERFVFDLVGRDANIVRELWAKVDAGESFDLSATPFFAQIAEFGFVSGRSDHADRLATIKAIEARYGVIVDTHTADGLKVALELKQADENVVVLETALPAKFEATIFEALGRHPQRPAGLENIESLPQRVEVMDANVEQIKQFISARVS